MKEWKGSMMAGFSGASDCGKGDGGVKRDLPYFEIEGAFGGNQDWFTNVVMNMGGCAAATACDCCIYLGLRKGLEELYPYDIHALTREDYVAFSQIMKPYIRPRVSGVKKVSWFIDGFGQYIRDVAAARKRGVRLEMEEFPGSRPYHEARKMICAQIDAGYPVPYLLLRHLDGKFKDYIWHWFLLVGYEESGGGLLVKTATYGESDTFSLEDMWNTGCEEKGGLVKLRCL